MSEKFSLERVVGGTSSQREEALADLKDTYESQDDTELAEIEVEKTAEISRCIHIANEAVTAMLSKYGIEANGVPEKNVHIIKREEWDKHMPGAGASFNLTSQGIRYPEEESSLYFVYHLIHEMIHFNTYQAAQITTDNTLSDYRVGLSVDSRDGKVQQLRNINEAVTENLTMEAMSTSVVAEQLQAEIAKTNAVNTEYAEVKMTTVESEFDPETVFSQITGRNDDGSPQIESFAFTYKKEREALDILTTKIYEKNPEIYDNTDEVYRVFVNGAFTGNLLEIGRLLDYTFGQGTFRKIVENDSEDDFINFVKTL